MKVAVVIPCFRVRKHILMVLQRIGPEVSRIYVVDDACPDRSGNFVEERCTDERVMVLYNPVNLGVGGATVAGMAQGLRDGVDIIVKIDGDGQMDPNLIPGFVKVITSGEADYTKGNRFFEPEGLAAMPLSRLLGNAGLSVMSKFSTGYWQTLDPTNGFIAIHTTLLPLLPLDKIAERYFFESDLLCRLNIIGARVVDVPMHAHYGDEASSLRPLREVSRFTAGHIRNFFKRIIYNYFLRNFSLASLELILGVLLLPFGLAYGAMNWGGDQPATPGTVMVSALPVIIGVQFLLAFLNYDIQSVPTIALHPRLSKLAELPKSIEVLNGNHDEKSDEYDG